MTMLRLCLVLVMTLRQVVEVMLGGVMVGLLPAQNKSECASSVAASTQTTMILLLLCVSNVGKSPLLHQAWS